MAAIVKEALRVVLLNVSENSAIYVVLGSLKAVSGGF